MMGGWMREWGVAAVVAIGLFLLLVGGGYMLAATRYEAQLDAQDQAHGRELQTLRADLEAKRADAERQARETEARWRADIDKVASDARNQVQAAQRDAVAAAAVSDSLRERAAQLARACRPAPATAATAPGGQAASNPGDLLADLFARADAAAGELARIADERGAAGAGCERAAGAVRH